jgi:uncharacterized membrane protein
MGALMTTEVKMVPAITFYVLYLVSLIVLAVSPVLREQSWMFTVGLGVLLGVVVYASFGVANMFALKDWSITLTLVDVAWGAAVIALAAIAGFYAARIFSGF